MPHDRFTHRSFAAAIVYSAERGSACHHRAEATTCGGNDNDSDHAHLRVAG